MLCAPLGWCRGSCRAGFHEQRSHCTHGFNKEMHMEHFKVFFFVVETYYLMLHPWILPLATLKKAIESSPVFSALNEMLIEAESHQTGVLVVMVMVNRVMVMTASLRCSTVTLWMGGSCGWPICRYNSPVKQFVGPSCRSRGVPGVPLRRWPCSPLSCP